MKKIIATLIAAVFAAVTFSAVGADQVKPADSKPAKTAKKHKKMKAQHKTEEAATPAKQ